MIVIAQKWQDGFVQRAAFASAADAREHLAWMASFSVLFAAKPVRYLRGANGRFISRSSL